MSHAMRIAFPTVRATVVMAVAKIMTGTKYNRRKMMSTLKVLASAMMPCLHLRGDGMPQPAKTLGDGQLYCYACVDQDTPGQVPRIPGLRVPCRSHYRDDAGSERCEDRNGLRDCPGYTLVSEAEALAVLLEWAAIDNYEIITFYMSAATELPFSCNLAGQEACEAATFPEALAAALCKALRLEVSDA